jgi:hypothetical protein
MPSRPRLVTPVTLEKLFRLAMVPSLFRILLEPLPAGVGEMSHVGEVERLHAELEPASLREAAVDTEIPIDQAGAAERTEGWG